MDITQIMATIPHRYPFLLVDRILELEPGKRAVGVKNVTLTEYFFSSQRPESTFMPGILIVEHGAQVGAILLLSVTENNGKLALFTGVDRVKFRRKVAPGDQLVTEVTMIRMSGKAGKARVVCRVNGEVAAQGRFTFVLVPDPAKRVKGEE